MIFEPSKPINSLHGKIAILLASQMSDAIVHAGFPKDVGTMVFDSMTDVLLTKSDEELVSLLRSMIGENVTW